MRRGWPPGCTSTGSRPVSTCAPSRWSSSSSAPSAGSALRPRPRRGRAPLPHRSGARLFPRVAALGTFRFHPLARKLMERTQSPTLLVTGGAGFIGSAVVRHLVRETGYRVVNVDKLTYAGNLESLAEVEGDPRYVFERVDVCDAAEVARLFATYRPAGVIHLAAESHVDRSIDGPAAFVQTNLVGTFTLRDAARVCWAGLPGGARDAFRFLDASTDEVYGALGDDGVFTEETPYDPSSPYSASKAGSDHLARAWHRTYGLPVVVTNCSNNYGPYQFPEKLLPVIILNALNGRELPVYGKGENVRDWLYVEDHAT